MGGMIERKRGKIVFISSQAGISPSPGLAVHSGTKHMLEGVASSLRQELRGSGVSVGVVRPGGVKPPGHSHATGSDKTRALMEDMGIWVPTSPDDCLDPLDVADVVGNVVQIMEKADVQAVNVLNNI